MKTEFPLGLERASAVCEEAFPADPDFPQLGIAGDPALMLGMFREHLKPICGKMLHIEECIPCRFRCRHSTSRCVLQYTLRLHEPVSGREWDQWVTGVIYARPGEAERLCREMQTPEARQEIPADWLTFEPVCFIPELGMLVQVFPFDRKLPNLSRVLDGAARELESRLLAPLGPGRWQVIARHVEPVRYRTELGAVLKYTVQAREPFANRSETRRCYLKAHRNQRGEQTYQLLHALLQRTEGGQRPFSVVKPLAYLSELRTLALEEAPGTSLQQILLEDGDPTEAVRAVARAVAAFNQGDLGLAQHSGLLTDQFDDVKRAAALIQWACPQTRDAVQSITTAVLGGLKEVPPVLIHGDLKTDHIFLSGDQVTFIDLDSAAQGDPVRDAAHLWAHIAGRVGLEWLPAAHALTFAAVFAAEYFVRVPEGWSKRFSLHRAGALLEVAASIFKRQEPSWRQTLPALVEEAALALKGELHKQ